MAKLVFTFEMDNLQKNGLKAKDIVDKAAISLGWTNDNPIPKAKYVELKIEQQMMGTVLNLFFTQLDIPVIPININVKLT